MAIKYLECPMIVYSSYQTLNVCTKVWQIQERHSLTEFAKKQAALNHLLPDKLEPHVISKMRHPTGTQYSITVLIVIIFSYIMPSVIIKHNNPLRIVCRPISLFCLV